MINSYKLLTVAGVSTLVASHALADLDNIYSGQTSLQSTTGAAILVVCPQLAGLQTRDPLQQDLFDRCREMVHGANALDGTGASADSIGLSAEELSSALQQVAGEEIASQGSFATEVANGQFANIGTRLSSLLRATSGGGATANVSGGNYFGAGRPYGGAAQAGAEVELGGRLGVFVRGQVGFGEKDPTPQEDAFELDTSGLSFGIDYRFTDRLVLGLGLGYDNFDSDFDRTATVAGGEVEADGLSLSAYSLLHTGKVYVNGIISTGSLDYEMARRVFYQPGTGATGTGANGGADRTLTSETESDQLAAALTVGWDIYRGNFNWSPYLRINYLDVDVDPFVENDPVGGLALAFDKQTIESVQAVVGAQFTWTLSRNFGIMSPYLRAELHHETSDDARNIATRYANDPFSSTLLVRTDDPDENFASLGLGIAFVYRNGSQFFVDFDSLAGLDEVSYSVLTLGFRGEF